MIHHPFLNSTREAIRIKNDSITQKRIKWIHANHYYYRQFIKALRYIIDENSRILHVRCSTGFVLNALKPSYGVGIEDSSAQVDEARKCYPYLHFINQSVEDIKLDEKFDYILISSIEDTVDLKAVLDGIVNCITPNTRIIIVHYNYLWHPLVRLAEKLSLKIPQRLHNWFSDRDLKNILHLCNFDVVIQKKLILYPFFIPLLSYFFNRFVARLPFFRNHTLIRLTVARLNFHEHEDFSVSIIIPCKNEAGNVEDAVTRIPTLGKHTEIIFCDDKSTDGTPDKVREMMQRFPEKDIKLVNGPGICKAENVWVGFDAAQGDILMILDADLTVIPEELPYFYEAIARRRGEFINGSRLVYPMHGKAMKLFNIIGNKFFSLFFSYILGTPIKDTLCGTKVIWKRDYERVKKLRGSWGVNDRWGDYELIFGASKCHLKIIDLPVHYYERIYGETKMTHVIKNGIRMFKMCWAALFKIKFN